MDDGRERAERIAAAVTGAVAAGQVPGAAWWVGVHGEVVSRGAAGGHVPGTDDAVRPDTVFRIASTTKPVVAAAAMALVDEGALALDEPVDALLPELADPRVLADPADPEAGTVPAERPITVRDVLTFRLGTGLDFTAPWPSPTLAALAAAGLPVGPPAPQAAPGPDEWMRRLGTVPLAAQPGSRWLYHVGASVLGVLVSRAAGRPLPAVLAERVLRPAGMGSTGFGVPASARDRLGPHWTPPGPDGAREVYDPADGQWASAPAFPDAGDGLVSTVDDLAAFARVLRSGGCAADGTRVLGEAAVRAMTTEQVGPVDDEGGGWGLGLGVRRTDEPGGRHAGSYGWDGGLGSTWWTDPVTGTTAVLLTNQMWASPEPPPLFAAFRRAAFGQEEATAGGTSS
ncbi:serine hydrolase domain-containing protein [Blastococcus xanthinilyticus]|uniref:CubicO group peptidase (Beta-lactamase class C family) n=1 Tax=Blastococcus xanthinilyticus TaxID=1564164 RepID=A0A5S5D3B8_9ACTN|nr:serine hydrolase domain-containing protein [Blastococcus xanthinilyticus]TYP89768.1 CubicO group peptidase (beta-lactamase class C family) [Blastococcus xanthinilyticus]